MTPAWIVAAALALACGLDWGRWAARLTVQPTLVTAAAAALETR